MGTHLSTSVVNLCRGDEGGEVTSELQRLVHLEHALGRGEVRAVRVPLLLPVGARALGVLGERPLAQVPVGGG